MSHENPNTSSRREFLKTSTIAAGALAGSLAFSRSVHAAGDDTLKLGLIGCGGRGTGAANNALNADQNIKLVAMADTFEDKIKNSLNQLTKELKEKASDKIAVSEDHHFSGFDAYQKLIDSGVDVVILATPPHFRPTHLKAAVAAGKHCFVEKPISTDAPGVRSVMATCEEARQKNLSIVSGLCYRYDIAKREVYNRVFDGAIGDILAMQVNYLTGTLRYNGRKPEWSDLEWQLRNWQFFTWLSGDHNVEQHIHSLDKAAWAMHDEPPAKCMAVGGRQMRDPSYGNVYDHFATVYEYPSGQKLFSRCRQMDGCDGEVTDFLFGTKGIASLMSHKIEGENKWHYSGKAPDMYQQEHDEFMASIRAGKPINNGEYMCRSTLMAIMQRMSAYTGKQITWDQALNSKEDFNLPEYKWGPAPEATIAKPGITKFV
jgi:myo-inositol 2-dehydrogenase / D-chiro-inositol 1-dehydrogenase